MSLITSNLTRALTRRPGFPILKHHNFNALYSPKRNSTLTNPINTSSPKSPLPAQRLRRPVAPAMTIYKWNYISSASALQRITGVALSGTLYLGFTFYLAAPVMGIHLDSASVVAAFGSVPLAVKTAVKLFISMPFTYHAFNGIKHLIWDTGRFLTKYSSGRATWVVLFCSVCTSLGLTVISL